MRPVRGSFPPELLKAPGCEVAIQDRWKVQEQTMVRKGSVKPRDWSNLIYLVCLRGESCGGPAVVVSAPELANGMVLGIGGPGKKAEELDGSCTFESMREDSVGRLWREHSAYWRECKEPKGVVE